MQNIELSESVKKLVEKIQNNDTNVDAFVDKIYCNDCNSDFEMNNTICNTCKRCNSCNAIYRQKYKTAFSAPQITLF